jgi:hypothetical protein
MAALLKANAVRMERGVVKRELRAGRVGLAEALEHPACQTMLIIDLLAVQHCWGTLRATRLLALARITHGLRVGHLTDRQRDQVAAFAAVSPRPWSAFTRSAPRAADG